MTIDEAINKHKKLKILAERTNDKRGAFYSGEEHEQLAELLEELKDYRDKNKMVVRVDVENMDEIKDNINELSKYAESQYNKAIDDFTESIIFEIKSRYPDAPIVDIFGSMEKWKDKNSQYFEFENLVYKIAKQLKVGESNGTDN